jgi:hypothetical protein
MRCTACGTEKLPTEFYRKNGRAERERFDKVCKQCRMACIVGKWQPTMVRCPICERTRTVKHFQKGMSITCLQCAAKRRGAALRGRRKVRHADMRLVERYVWSWISEMRRASKGASMRLALRRAREVHDPDDAWRIKFSNVVIGQRRRRPERRSRSPKTRKATTYAQAVQLALSRYRSRLSTRLKCRDPWYRCMATKARNWRRKARARTGNDEQSDGRWTSAIAG